MHLSRRLIAAGLLALSLAAAGCGTERTAEESRAEATEETTGAEAPAAEGGAATVGPISKDLTKKPAIPTPAGDPPATLKVRDIVTGTGPAAKAGDTVTVRYVGASWSTGAEFDASWDRGEPFPFPLGAGQVIPGWDKGVAGMKKGGRRELVIPPDLAYGPTGQGTIGPDETLVFVVDLEKITPG
jgi:peptidylprolyl isomerase